MADITGGGARGSFRMEGDGAGYNAYVGAGAPPDFTAAPDVYSAALPFTVPLAAAPPATTVTYHVVVRAVDDYGLESQNQQASLFIVDDAGDELLPDIGMPQGLYAEQDGTSIRVRANYPTLADEAHPADQWQIWIQDHAPVGLPDGSPTLYTSVNGPIMASLTGPYAADDYYVSVALSRSSDARVTEVITVQLTTLPAPAAPTAVS